MSTPTIQPNRVPSGVSTGGQYAAAIRQEAPGGLLRVVKQESPAELAFYDAGGFEEGDFFRVDSISRSDEGAWTVEFREMGDDENDSYRATWSAEDGFKVDDTVPQVNAEWVEKAFPGRTAPDAFTRDLLDTDEEGATAFFEKAEATWQENEPPF